MGYELHITRQVNWFDQDESREISFAEWMDYLTNEKEMHLEGFAEAATSAGDMISVKSEGLSVWTLYSGNGLNGNYAWFDYCTGNVVCKNPDDEIIHKMLDIAHLLSAKVQVDDSEVYKRTAHNKISSEYF